MKLIEELQNVPDKLDKRTLYDEADVVRRAITALRAAEKMAEAIKNASTVHGTTPAQDAALRAWNEATE